MDYFPLVTAKGSAFCNRTQELKHLERNINNVKPTLIMSPRRYGKTSLALKAFDKSHKLYTHIDLYRDLDESHIEHSIMNGIGELLGKLESKPQKLLQLINEFFSGIQINLSFKDINLSVGIKEKKKRISDNIMEALSRLNNLAKKRNQKIILFMDEFQQLSEATQDHSIEASIRHASQLSTHVVYIFSGSNRHLLENMFFDKKRPFYKLCDLILLERIKKQSYDPYIQKAAIKQWEKKLADNVLSEILDLTQCHSYYVNLLCSKLWLGNYPSTIQMINDCWKKIMLENKSQIENELSLLSLNQRKLLIAFSNYGPITQPNGKEFLNMVNLPQTSVAQALSTLIQKDYIIQNDKKGYELLDPLINYFLSRQN